MPASVGVDETSITRGHEYITVVNALSEARVLDVIDERKEESLNAFWSQYTADELARVEKVAMDMWPPYIASTRKHLTIADEKIVFDKFHIMKHLGDAVAWYDERNIASCVRRAISGWRRLATGGSRIPSAWRERRERGSMRCAAVRCERRARSATRSTHPSCGATSDAVWPSGFGESGFTELCVARWNPSAWLPE